MRAWICKSVRRACLGSGHAGVLAVLILLCLCLEGSARADAVSLLPASDKDVASFYPFSSAIFVDPESAPIITIGVDSASNPGIEYRSALEFDLSSLPSGATIDGASLNFTVYGFDTFPGVEVHGYAGDGVVETADMLVVNLLDTFSAPGGSIDVDITIDATSFIQSLVNASMDYAGFSLRTTGGSFVIRSREWSIPDQRPSLDVAFSPGAVPDAPSLPLLAIGLSGLALLRRAVERRGARQGEPLE